MFFEKNHLKKEKNGKLGVIYRSFGEIRKYGLVNLLFNGENMLNSIYLFLYKCIIKATWRWLKWLFCL